MPWIESIHLNQIVRICAKKPFKFENRLEKKRSINMSSPVGIYPSILFFVMTRSYGANILSVSEGTHSQGICPTG